MTSPLGASPDGVALRNDLAFGLFHAFFTTNSLCSRNCVVQYLPELGELGTRHGFSNVWCAEQRCSKRVLQSNALQAPPAAQPALAGGTAHASRAHLATGPIQHASARQPRTQGCRGTGRWGPGRNSRTPRSPHAALHCCPRAWEARDSSEPHAPRAGEEAGRALDRRPSWSDLLNDLRPAQWNLPEAGERCQGWQPHRFTHFTRLLFPLPQPSCVARHRCGEHGRGCGAVVVYSDHHATCPQPVRAHVGARCS